jgi:hypothetical protein
MAIAIAREQTETAQTSTLRPFPKIKGLFDCAGRFFSERLTSGSKPFSNFV